MKQTDKILADQHVTDRILLALCHGFFINVARLTSESLARPQQTTLQSSPLHANPSLDKLWVTLRDGQLVRYDPMTKYYSIPLEESYFHFVIFTEMVGYSRQKSISAPTSSFSVGAIRVISAVQYDWIKPLLKRFTQLDVRRLALRREPLSHTSTHSCSKTSVLTPFKTQITLEPVTSTIVQNTEEKEKKVQTAREKYLARRTQRNPT